MQYIVHVQPEVSSRTYNQPATVDSELFVEHWRFDPCSNFDLQYFCHCQSSIETPMPTPMSEVAKATLQYFCQSSVARFWSSKYCNWGWTEELQWRIDRSIPSEACQGDSPATGKPPLEYFRQSSIAMIQSILNCNTCSTRVLQQRIDKSIATLL